MFYIYIFFGHTMTQSRHNTVTPWYNHTMPVLPWHSHTMAQSNHDTVTPWQSYRDTVTPWHSHTMTQSLHACLTVTQSHHGTVTPWHSHTMPVLPWHSHTMTQSQSPTVWLASTICVQHSSTHVRRVHRWETTFVYTCAACAHVSYNIRLHLCGVCTGELQHSSTCTCAACAQVSYYIQNCKFTGNATFSVSV